MPDAALEATERQFTDLIRAATPNAVVLLKLFAMPELPRGEAARSALAGRYRDIAELWDTPLDGLIVTGTEPRAKNLTDEPYWETLEQGRRLGERPYRFDDLVLSCRACGGIAQRRHRAPRARAKAVRRVRLPAGRRSSDDRAFSRAALGAAFALQRSAGKALAACGYKILTRSNAAGVDAFAKQDGSFFLFFQGHPEYEADTLLARIPPRRRALPRRRARALSGSCRSAISTTMRRPLAEAFRTPGAARPARRELIAEFPEIRSRSRPAMSVAGGGARHLTKSGAPISAPARRSGGPSPCRCAGVRQRRTWRDWPLGARRQPGSSVP